MEWKDILPFHRNPPDNQLYRSYEVQTQYENDRLSEKELKKKLFKNGGIWILTKNKYPYHFTDNTEHYVIWFKYQINYTLIDFLLRDYDNVVYFENKTQNKSIKTIPHVHIFLKN